ncbi:MAG: Fic family protein [Chloroflexota bacterium]
MSTPQQPDTGGRPVTEWAEVVFAGDALRTTLSKAVGRGRLRRLATGIYTGAVMRDPETVVLRNWSQILAHEFPGAVIADRSARKSGPDHGLLTIVHDRRRPLVLPGLTIIPRRGPGALDGDTLFDTGIVLSSQARALLDNASGQGERYLSAVDLETWISDIVEQQGEAGLNQVRDRARELSKATRQISGFDLLNRKISAALTTSTDTTLVSPALVARAAGEPFDRRRVEMFEAFVDVLRATAPEPMPALPIDAERRRLVPFYEAYFSNYIEGTEFSLDEAAAIVFGHEIPSGRPEDAHDVLGTYQVVSNELTMRHTPRDASDFIALLKERHVQVLGGRPDARPGRFKDRANRAGATSFVDPKLVDPTLRAGFDRASGLIDPFSRAAYLMFLVSEVHPFTDGNGRIARIAMNSELVAAGQVRIIIPTVYRTNYLAALKGATHNSNFTALIAVLRFAQEYTAAVDFTSRATAEADLARTNAFRDAQDADDYGVRLILP